MISILLNLLSYGIFSDYFTCTRSMCSTLLGGLICCWVESRVYTCGYVHTHTQTRAPVHVCVCANVHGGGTALGAPKQDVTATLGAKLSRLHEEQPHAPPAHPRHSGLSISLPGHTTYVCCG